MGKKAIRIVAVIAIIGIIGFVSTHCTKIEPVRVIKVITGQVTDITPGTCNVSGDLIDLGESAEVSQHGFAISNNTNLENVFKHTQLNRRLEVGKFSEQIDGLTPGTDYHIWAYASNGNEFVYGEMVSFRTDEENPFDPPQIITKPVLEITWNSAVSGGNISHEGSAQVTTRGLCWGTNPNPTIEAFSTYAGEGPGEFTITMTELVPGTQYFVRAFALTSDDLYYANEQAFTTSPEPAEPLVVTAAVDEVEANSAHPGGSIDSDGGAPIISKGFCWNTEPNPTLANDNLAFEGIGSEPFDMVIRGLDHDTEYYIRAYATNSAGKTGYGQQKVFRTQFLCGEILLDPRDMEEYPTIGIGEQCWLAQNLRAGETVPTSSEQGDNGNIERYCYEDDEGNCATFGGLYTWGEMMQHNPVESSQGVCPERWHVPSDAEWITMETFLGMQASSIDSLGFYRGYNFEGDRLKSTETHPWIESYSGTVDPYLFSALPSGMVWSDGSSTSLGDFTVFWTSTLSEESAVYRMLHRLESGIGRFLGDPANSTPVRCIKD